MTTRVMFSTLFDRNIIFLMWFRLGYTLGLLRRIRPILFFLLCMASWRRLVVRASDLQSSPERLQVRVPAAPLHVTTLGKLFTHNVPMFTKQYKLVPAIGWEGNRSWSSVALAMRHRLSGISIYTGSMAWERVIELRQYYCQHQTLI